MFLTSQGKDLLYLGIDGGGSKCRARLESSNQECLAMGVAGPANTFQNLEQAICSVVEATKQALQNASLPPRAIGRIVAGVALAGLHSPKIFREMSNWKHPFKALFLTNDLHAACLGAHCGGDGAVAIVGTGSCGYVSMGSETKTFGAHGFPMGDKGSGAWMGLEILKAVLLAHDSLGPKTIMSDVLYQRYGTEGIALVDEFMRAPPAKYARIAPLVFEAARVKDPVATSIVQEGAEYIQALIASLIKFNPPRLSLLGGLAPSLSSWLEEDSEKLLSPPNGTAEEGAIYFARREYLKRKYSAA